ncbi:oxidoreductase, partial [Lactiplantibacillus plantarum]
NAYSWQIAQINALAVRYGYPQFVSIQSHYNLVYREDERELFSYAHENGLATTPYSPLASGRLAHPFGTQTTRRQQDTFTRYLIARYHWGLTFLIRRRSIKRVRVNVSWDKD